MLAKPAGMKPPIATPNMKRRQSITAIDPTPAAVVRNLLTLGLVLPAHVLFAKFLWMRRDPGEGWLLLLAPLNVPALALTDVNTVRVLGVLGIAFSATQFFAGRFIKVAANTVQDRFTKNTWTTPEGIPADATVFGRHSRSCA